MIGHRPEAWRDSLELGADRAEQRRRARVGLAGMGLSFALLAIATIVQWLGGHLG